MRILHVDTGRTLRGGQHQLLLLLRGLRARGHQQTLLARRALLTQWKGEPVGPLRLFQASRQADIVHAHDARSHTLAVLFCPGRPLVVSRRVAFAPKQNPLSRWKYSKADCLVAVSQHVRQVLVEAGIPAERIRVIYDAIGDLAASGAPRRKESAPGTNRRSIVLAPKLNDPLKGASLLREACERLDVDLRFSPDLRHDLPNADIFVYLSESEGLGSALLLAMAQQVPIVASRIGGIPELIEDETSGLLVENDPISVAGAIQRLLEDSSLAQRLATAAWQRANENFRDDIMVRQTEQLYSSLLHSSLPSC